MFLSIPIVVNMWQQLLGWFLFLFHLGFATPWNLWKGPLRLFCATSWTVENSKLKPLQCLCLNAPRETKIFLKGNQWINCWAVLSIKNLLVTIIWIGLLSNWKPLNSVYTLKQQRIRHANLLQCERPYDNFPCLYWFLFLKKSY